MDIDIFKANLFTPGLMGRWGMPRIYWGPPGVGKTAKVKQIAQSMGFTVITILGSIRDPSDFSGLPIPIEVKYPDGTSKTVVRMTPAEWAVEAAKNPHVLVFFDEFSCTSPMVQQAMLRVILEGTVGDYQLPPTVRMMAAANPPEMAAGGFELSPPMANRFGHENTNLTAAGGATMSKRDVQDWAHWMLTGGECDTFERIEGFDPAKREIEVVESFKQHYTRARGQVVGFMLSAAGGAKNLLNMPDVTSGNSGGAWSSPRSWECAARALASGRLHALGEKKTNAWMASHVGPGGVAAFHKYVQDSNMPDPIALLDGKATWQFNPRDLGAAHCVLAECTAVLLDPECEKLKARSNKMWEILDPITQKNTDVAMTSVRALIGKGLVTGKACAVPISKMKPILMKAGMMGRQRF